MDSQQPGAAIKPRAKWAMGSAIGVVLYGAFVALCFYMEREGRTRFRVPSEADIAAIDGRTQLLRTETARGNALAEMREWTPYAIYSTGVGVVVLLGTAIATVLGALVVWRGVRRDSVRKAKVLVVGVLRFIAIESEFDFPVSRICIESQQPVQTR